MSKGEKSPKPDLVYSPGSLIFHPPPCVQPKEYRREKELREGGGRRRREKEAEKEIGKIGGRKRQEKEEGEGGRRRRNIGIYIHLCSCTVHTC